jgi:anti-sigma factor RsiW
MDCEGDEAMACEPWITRLDTYLDGELSADEARALEEHLRGCPACAAESLRKVQQNRAVHAAGQRFLPDPAFRTRIQKSIAVRRAFPWNRGWSPVLATAAVLLVAGASLFTLHRDRTGQRQLISELVDLHVATLASVNPVDIVSSDRHTVKPWFEGKIPFTFSLPELQDSPFALIGGRVSYLRQSPGAELIFRVRQHQISVFIFQEKGLEVLRREENLQPALSFELRSWQHNGLRYFVIGDAGAQDLDKLTELLKAAG